MPQPPFIKIIVHPQEGVQFQSNITSLIGIYGLLEGCKDVAKEYFQNQATKNIMPANAGVLEQLKGN
jgi:hypothetical protein